MIKRILPPFIISIAAFGIIYLVYTHTNLFLGMERNLLSGYFSIREPEINEINPYVSNRVRLIGYDEDSIAVIGKWPWQRYVHAGFLDKSKTLDIQGFYRLDRANITAHAVIYKHSVSLCSNSYLLSKGVLTRGQPFSVVYLMA